MNGEIKALLVLFGSIFILVGVLGVASYLMFGAISVEDIRQFVSRQGALSPLIFVGITLAFVIIPPAPNDLMAVVGGILFGFWPGLILTLAAFELGSVIAFVIGMKAGHPLFSKIAPNQTNRYVEIFAKYGVFAVLVSRMIPVVSFDLVSYISGIFKLDPAKFAVATFIGMLPTTLLLVKIGDTIFTNTWNVIWYFSALVAVSLVGLYIFNRFKDSDGKLRMWFYS